MSLLFPDIAVRGPAVDARQYVEKGTRGATVLGYFAAVFGVIAATAVSYGVFLVVLLFTPLFAWYLRRTALARIHGSGVRVDEAQFPQIHQCVQTFRQRLGLTKDVETYIVEANIANAFAVRLGRKNIILLTDDLIHGCLAIEKPQALSFVIAHELAHIALGHNGVLKSWMAQWMKKLGRLNEYSADATATALLGDRQLAYQGLLLLTVGFALVPYVNHERLLRQAEEVALDKYTKKAERPLSHPLLLNRVRRVLQPGL